MLHFFRLQRGDPTLSVLELWGAEYQESNALLLRPSDRSFLERVCQREKCPVDFVGNITGDSKVGIKTTTCSPLWKFWISKGGFIVFAFALCYDTIGDTPPNSWVSKSIGSDHLNVNNPYFFSCLSLAYKFCMTRLLHAASFIMSGDWLGQPKTINFFPFHSLIPLISVVFIYIFWDMTLPPLCLTAVAQI